MEIVCSSVVVEFNFLLFIENTSRFVSFVVVVWVVKEFDWFGFCVLFFSCGFFCWIFLFVKFNFWLFVFLLFFKMVFLLFSFIFLFSSLFSLFSSSLCFIFGGGDNWDDFWGGVGVFFNLYIWGYKKFLIVFSVVNGFINMMLFE